MDFSEFWEPSWEGKSIQDRSKIDPKGHQKNDRKKKGLLEASWRRLGTPKSTGAAARGRGGGYGGGYAEAPP